MADETKVKKTSKVKKVHFYADGESGVHARKDEVALEFQFVGVTDVLRIERAEIADDVAVCAMWHGIAQKIGDTYAGAKDGAEALEKAQPMYDRLMEGEWIGERLATGPSTSLLAEAIFNVKTNAGKLGEGETIATIAERYKGDKEGRDKAMAHPAVAAAYAQIQSDRAAEKARKLAEAALEALTGETEVADEAAL